MVIFLVAEIQAITVCGSCHYAAFPADLPIYTLSYTPYLCNHVKRGKAAKKYQSLAMA